MIIIPEIELKTLLDLILSFIKKDFEDNQEDETFIFRLFKGNKFGKYDYFDQGKDLFTRGVDHPRHIETRFFFDSERASLPTIHITLPSEQSGDDGIGVDEGYQEPIVEGGKLIPIYTRRFDTQFNIVCTSDNTFEVLLMYHTVQSLLISSFDILEGMFMSNPKLGGMDLNIYQEIVPPNVFMRAVTLTFSHEKNVPRIFSSEDITKIVFNKDTSNIVVE